MYKAYHVLEGNNWENLKEVILFGFGRQGKKAFETLKKDFAIKAIVENDRLKEGINIQEVPVLHFETARDLLRDYKIIITTTERYYVEIAEQLECLDLTENVDFVSYQQFVKEWYWQFQGKLYIPKTDLPITSFCSLNCEKCHIFIPYWKNKAEYELHMLKHSVDVYFKYVDYVLDMDILGGEPLLYRNLKEIIAYIGDNYRRQIGYLGLITNGTMIPDEMTIALLKKYDMHVSISDYSQEIDYKKKIDLLCEKLENANVRYLRNDNITWFDFGLPTDEVRYPRDKAIEHMKCCNTIYHVIHEGKFYCCGTAWAAQKSGLFPESEYGFVDLDNQECDVHEMKKDILECSLGMVQNGYLEFCQICGGFGDDNHAKVPTAKQLKKRGNNYE